MMVKYEGREQRLTVILDEKGRMWEKLDEILGDEMRWSVKLPGMDDYEEPEEVVYYLKEDFDFYTTPYGGKK